jgi:hypothetical protein
VDPAERRTGEYGLDVPCVAIVTAERTIECALIPFPHPSRGPDLAKAALEPAEEAEMLLIRLIEWTVVEAETSDTVWNKRTSSRDTSSVCTRSLFPFSSHLFIRLAQLAGG